MKCKILVFENSFGSGHREQVRRQGHNPDWAWVCREVECTGPEGELPESLRQAVRFARDARPGDTGVVNLGDDGRTPTGRLAVVGRFRGTLDGRPCGIRYLVGFTDPGAGTTEGVIRLVTRQAGAPAGGPAGPAHAQLRQLVLDFEPLLRHLWGRRQHDDDMLVLADMRRTECRRLAKGWWLEDEIRIALEGGRPFLPYLQPAKLIDVLLADEPGPQREAGKELRGFACAGFVPLWVVVQGGHWATCWAPPGSGMVVVRHEPRPKPEPKPEDN
jgi:hypothetical protein